MQKEFESIIDSGKWQLNGGSLCGPGTDRAAGAIRAMDYIFGLDSILFRLPTRPKILDIGCGDGTWITLFHLLDQCDYHGIDCSENNLIKFKNNLKEMNRAPVTLQIGDAS